MVYVIRHGQTDLNRRHVLQGRVDQPLNETGLAQAQAAAAALGGVIFDRVFSSPLVRAIRTAEILSPGSRIETDERLIEMDYGPYEQCDLTAMPEELRTFFGDITHRPTPPGMEPLEAVTARAGSFVEERCKTGGSILISTHAIAMKGILEYLTPESKGGYWSKFIGNCAIYTFEYKNGAFSVPVEKYAPTS